MTFDNAPFLIVLAGMSFGADLMPLPAKMIPGDGTLKID